MEVYPSTMSLLFVILMGFLCSSHAHTFEVGGDDGWTLHPSENYKNWAERHRFQINDVVVFKYTKGDDSVLVVNKDDYLKCNKDNPIKTLNNGLSNFKFTKSGPFFFISGHEQNCEKGQKLIVVVLSPHHRNNTHNAPSPQPSPEAPPQPRFSSPSPSSTTQAPTVEPPSHSPSPSPEPETPTHAPPVEPPSHTPSPSSISDHSPSPVSPKAEPPQHHPHAPATGSHHTASPPQHAPAPAPTPAPSAAPTFGGSFALLLGISFATVMISAGFV